MKTSSRFYRKSNCRGTTIAIVITVVAIVVGNGVLSAVKWIFTLLNEMLKESQICMLISDETFDQ